MIEAYESGEKTAEMFSSRGLIGRWSACSLCFLINHISVCSGSLPMPLTPAVKGPVTAQIELHLPLERRDATATCAGQTGYIACAPSLGGGCCPENLVCGTREDCVADTTATTASVGLVCDSEYFKCATSLGGEDQDLEICQDKTTWFNSLLTSA